MMKKGIKVIDMPMGTGKTTGMINYMNRNKSNRYLFITPFLEEIQRIKQSCKDLDFKEPNDKYTKLSSLKKLIANGHNITSTHSLFSIIDDDALHLLYLGGYTLVLDEVMEVIETMNVATRDIQLLLNDNVIGVNEDGLVYVKDEGYKGKGCKFTREISTIKNQMVYLVDNTLLLCLFNPLAFEVFEKTYVMTYLFNGSLMKSYMDLCKLDYKYCYIKNNKIVDGKYDDSSFRNKAKKLINIYYGKLNNIGENKNTLSASWYRSKTKKEEHMIMKNNMYNYFKNIINSNAKEAMWSTLTGEKEYYKVFYAPSSYKKNTFVACNSRATNNFSHKKNLIYAINVFVNPFIYKYINKNNIEFNEEQYALSQLLQWIWRSSIRDGKEINIYIPSKRMRNFLVAYLDGKM